MKLVRKSPGETNVSQATGVVAEAVVFSDGLSVLHWLTDPAGTEMYAQEEMMRRVRELSGRSEFVAE